MLPWKPTSGALYTAKSLLVGAYDMHIHSDPSVFARRADDRQAAEESKAAGMAGLVIKAHEGDTSARAQNLNKDESLLPVFGGVVLNHFSGGLNPAAVEISLRLGGRIVWFPTISSAQHVAYHAGKQFLGRSFQHDAGKGISLLQEDGSLFPEVYDILALTSEAEAMLCTGHISKEEVLAVAKAFSKGNYKGSLVYTHPDIIINKAPLEVQQEVANLGGFIEKCTLAGHTVWGGTSVQEFIHSSREIGLDRCFFSTDAGGTDRPSSPETLQTFVAAALDAGMREDEVKTMIQTVPENLLRQA